MGNGKYEHNMGKLKKILCAAMLLVTAMLFTACGAEVDTELTADSSFTGKRVITMTLSNSDLEEYVTGGADSIEKAVKKYLPEGMTYANSANADSLVYKFTVDFSGIDDYRTKINTILAANPDNSIKAEINYENVDSPFKSSLYFEENYSSKDLMGWLVSGLDKEGVVTYSDKSDWMSSGDSKAVINGEEYSCYSTMEVNDSTYNCASAIYVETEFLSGGMYNRTFEFDFYNDTIENLSSGGFDTEGYFKELAGDGTFEKTEEDSMTAYSITVNGDSAAILGKTASILCMENAKFDVTTSADKDIAGRMNISVSEYLDGSYYLKSNSRDSLRSGLILYDGVSSTGGGSASLRSTLNDDGKTVYYYYPAYIENGDAICEFVWDVTYDDIIAVLDFSGAKVSLALDMEIPSDMLPEAKTIFTDSINKSLPEGASVKESEDKDRGVTTVTVDLGKADPEKISARYRQFVYAYKGEKPTCTFSSEKAKSGSPFFSLNRYAVEIDFSALSDGENDLIFKGSSGLTILENSSLYIPEKEEPAEVSDDTAEDTESEETAEAAKTEETVRDGYLGSFGSTLRLYALEKSFNLIGTVAVIAAVICGIAFIVFFIVNIPGWIKAISAAKPAKTAQTAQPAQNVQTAPAAQPEQDSQPTQPVQQDTAEVKEPVAAAAAPSPAAENTAENGGNDNDEEDFI